MNSLAGSARRDARCCGPPTDPALGCWTRRMRGSSAAASRTMSAEPSVEPSSTTMCSKSANVWAWTLRSVACEVVGTVEHRRHDGDGHASPASSSTYSIVRAVDRRPQPGDEARRRSSRCGAGRCDGDRPRSATTGLISPNQTTSWAMTGTMARLRALELLGVGGADPVPVAPGERAYPAPTSGSRGARRRRRGSAAPTSRRRALAPRGRGPRRCASGRPARAARRTRRSTARRGGAPPSRRRCPRARDFDSSERTTRRSTTSCSGMNPRLASWGPASTRQNATATCSSADTAAWNRRAQSTGTVTSSSVISTMSWVARRRPTVAPPADAGGRGAHDRRGARRGRGRRRPTP